MRLLVSEIFRVYKKAPLQILSIWLMDLFEALIIVANPYVIGKCIDGLLQQDIVFLKEKLHFNLIYRLKCSFLLVQLSNPNPNRFSCLPVPFSNHQK